MWLHFFPYTSFPILKISQRHFITLEFLFKVIPIQGSVMTLFLWGAFYNFCLSKILLVTYHDEISWMIQGSSCSIISKLLCKYILTAEYSLISPCQNNWLAACVSAISRVILTQVIFIMLKHILIQISVGCWKQYLLIKLLLFSWENTFLLEKHIIFSVTSKSFSSGRYTA